MRTLILGLLLAACATPRDRTGDGDQGMLDGGSAGVERDAAAVDGPADGASPPFVNPVDAFQGPRLAGSAADLDLGTSNIGAAVRSAAVVITNTGNAESAALTANLMAGPELRLTSNCMGRRLRAGETCVVTANFEATSVGMKMASGSVTDGISTVSFTAKAVGRAAPDAGPDVARPLSPDGGMDAAVMDARMDARMDAGVDARRDAMAPAADLGVDVRGGDGGGG